MVYFTLTTDDPGCLGDLRYFSPTIAYKAATCVYEEQTQSKCVKDFTADNITTYPNPTQDLLIISLDPIDIETSYTVDLYDFNGEKIDSYLFQKGNYNECIIDLAPWKNGLYILHVISSNGFRSIHKVIKN